MKRSIYASFLILFLLGGTVIPITLTRSLTNVKHHFYGVVYKQATSLDSKFSHSKGALSDFPSSSRISAMTNALAATILFNEYNKGGSIDLLNIAQKIVKASRESFINTYHNDTRGFTSLYDFVKEDDSFVKSRLFFRDQFLMLEALTKNNRSLDEDDPGIKFSKDQIEDTKSFIEDHFIEPDNVWIDSVFTYDTTSYTKNKFILVENICWVIWAALHLPSGFNSPLSIDAITNMMDFLDANATSDSAIYNALSPTGDLTDQIFKLRTNALYGIINLLVYEKTDEERFLDRSIAILEFLDEKLWDPSYYGFFDVVGEQGLPIVQGKSLIGNALVCLLASRLNKYIPNDASFKSIYVHTNNKIEEFLYSSAKSMYYVSCDRDGDPLELHSLDSNLIRLWQRANSLHIINGTYPHEVSIGNKIQIILNLDNPDNFNYTIEVKGEEIDTFNITKSDTQVTLQIPLKRNADIGSTSIYVKIKVSEFIIDKSDSLSIIIGSDRRLPQGLVYLVALGILVCMVVIARYPPKNLEDLLARLASIGISEKKPPESDDSTPSKEVDIPQGED
ncbi:MAG: hypothetical protein ACXADY_13520 [Candidatus Hodarchaeales archaeon]|jgi:hypothetical protein